MAKTPPSPTTIDCEGFRLKVEFDYDPGHPGSMYRRNGDPGDPPTPAQLELTKVTVLVPKDNGPCPPINNRAGVLWREETNLVEILLLFEQEEVTYSTIEGDVEEYINEWYTPRDYQPGEDV